MSAATITPAAVAAATVAAPTTDSDALAAAVAAVSLASDGDTSARATLAAVSLARFAAHAARYSVTRDGVTVLPDNAKRDVQALVWLEATGRVTPPAAKERTPGETSLGQYASRYATVATNMAHGVAALADTESANEAYAAISDARAAAKANEKAAADALAEMADRAAFEQWLSTQPRELATAFAKVTHALTKGDAAPHAAAFVAIVTAAK